MLFRRENDPVDHSVDGFPDSTAPSVDVSVDGWGSGSGISTSVDVLPYSVAIPSPFRRHSVQKLDGMATE